MHLRNYERPEGWSKGLPEVLVTKRVVEKMGVPVVNYESLHQLMTDELDLPHGDKTSIRLYGRTEHTMIGGFHVPYTRTVHVNALVAEKAGGPVHGGMMRTLVHELRHRSDSRNRRVLTGVEIAARYVSLKAGIEAAEHLPFFHAHPAMAALGTRLGWYAIEPAEKRARKQETRLSMSPHRADILFPDTERATMMTLEGLVSEESAKMLHTEDYFTIFDLRSSQVEQNGNDYNITLKRLNQSTG